MTHNKLKWSLNLRWLEDVVKNPRGMKVKRWRQKAVDREELEPETTEAKAVRVRAAKE
jgi:hypothetical protein